MGCVLGKINIRHPIAPRFIGNLNIVQLYSTKNSKYNSIVNGADEIVMYADLLSSTVFIDFGDSLLILNEDTKLIRRFERAYGGMISDRFK